MCSCSAHCGKDSESRDLRLRHHLFQWHWRLHSHVSISHANAGDERRRDSNSISEFLLGTFWLGLAGILKTIHSVFFCLFVLKKVLCGVICSYFKKYICPLLFGEAWGAAVSCCLRLWNALHLLNNVCVFVCVEVCCEIKYPHSKLRNGFHMSHKSSWHY